MEDVFESLKTFKCDVTPIPWGGGVAGEFNSFYGKEHTKESRDLISKNRKNKCLGNSNGFTKENSLGLKPKVSYTALANSGLESNSSDTPGLTIS